MAQAEEDGATATESRTTREREYIVLRAVLGTESAEAWEALPGVVVARSRKGAVIAATENMPPEQRTGHYAVVLVKQWVTFTRSVEMREVDLFE